MAKKAEETLIAEVTGKVDKNTSILNQLDIENQESVYENITIEFLGLSTRAYNCLKRQNISFIGQIMSLSEDDLRSFRNMGTKSIGEVLYVQKKIRNGEVDFSGKEDTDLVIALGDAGQIKMIEKANPALIGKKIYSIYYKDRMGMRHRDCKIEEVGLSPRTLNCLKRESYDRISEVAFTEYEKISEIKNMGKVSIEELLAYFNNSVEYSIEQDVYAEKAEKLYDQIKNLLLRDYPIFDWTRYERSIKSCLDDLVVLKRNEFDDLSELIKDIFGSEDFLSEVEMTIVENIRSANREMSIDMLFYGFPSTFKDCGLEVKVLKSLEDKGTIERYNKGYRIKLPSVADWLESLSDNKRQAVILRLEGKTLKEAGEEMGLTRERVRQLVNNAIQSKPQLREDDYAYWYSKYEVDSEAMELKYAQGEEFFTIHSLVRDGYDHPLHHRGFGEWFNSALIKNSKRISFIRTGGTILFYEGTVKRTTVDLLRQVLSNYKVMDVSDLLDLLQEDYGICIRKEKIVQLVKESEMYYDSTTGNLYLNKEYFMKNNDLEKDDIDEDVVIIKINRLYKDGISAEALYEATRGIWKRRIESVEGTDYCLSVFKGKVVEVYKIDEWLPAGSIPMKTRTIIPEHTVGRVEFVGKVAPDAIRNKYIGRSVAKLFKYGEASPIKVFRRNR